MVNAVPVTANYLFDIGFERDEHTHIHTHTEKQWIRTKEQKHEETKFGMFVTKQRSETLSKMPVK